jgi:hypothetical protein
MGRLLNTYPGLRPLRGLAAGQSCFGLSGRRLQIRQTDFLPTKNITTISVRS